MPAEALIISLSIVILLFSVILHEVMHGYVARMFGDRTAEHAGRLTLNPIPHIDPIGTILLPALLFFLPLLTGIHSGFLIGWAKPVPVNPLNFKDIKRGEIYVSLAGIAANLALALLGAAFYHLTLIFVGPNDILLSIFQFTVGINLMLAIFNLLPIPPLDGSKALGAVLPYQYARSLDRIAPYGMLILLALLYFNVIGFILRFVLIPLHILLQIPLI